MPQTWLAALEAYWFGVNLSRYRRAREFPGFFERDSDDRASTKEFEDYFREKAPERIEVWYEVVFWKLFNQPFDIPNRSTNRIVTFTQQEQVAPGSLWATVQRFAGDPTLANLRRIRGLLGLGTGMAVPLTFVAFADPDRYPMVDRRVAGWVDRNMLAHNANRVHELAWLNPGVLLDNDFPSYLSWVYWCQEVATVLSTKTDIVWRARDVEMAVFTAYDKKLSLSVLP